MQIKPIKIFPGYAFLLPVFICLTGASFGQNFSYPKFAKSVSGMDKVIISDWFVKDSAVGDLNGDHVADFAMVAEYKVAIDELRPDSTVNTGSPRILLIYFKNPQSRNFDLAAQHNTFIVRYGEGGMDPEAYDHISIVNRVLNISYSFLRGGADYKFRYQQNDFYLIGASNSGESGGDINSWDINFVTKKAYHEWGKIDDKNLKGKWIDVPLKKLKTLKELRMQFSWEVMPYVFI